MVLDTEEFMRLCEVEAQKYRYAYVQFGSVNYTGTDELSEMLARHIPSVRDYIPSVWFDALNIPATKKANMQEMFEAVNEVFPMVKDGGFREECEARLACCPLVDLPELENRMETRETKFRDRQGTIVPYVELFEDLGQQLPIEKIIVGPTRYPERRCEGLRQFIKANGYKDVKIVISEIPFAGD